jgi:hypothetical protein
MSNRRPHPISPLDTPAPDAARRPGEPRGRAVGAGDWARLGTERTAAIGAVLLEAIVADCEGGECVRGLRHARAGHVTVT